ncbi:Uncharacterized protein M6B38_237550 [Iris pallida]|uniref:SLH domain-containing protein n=1 Tax=Iris pallida TaxID=29817 RepID=A0AAX6DM39_IRIPA|nr:Uncharacterized protein M6B38_237550 [Iris pallida]
MVSSLQFPPPSFKFRSSDASVKPWSPPPSSSRIRIRKRFPSLVLSSEKSAALSWEESSTDEFGGWFVQPEVGDRKGTSKFVVAGVGTSMAILIGVLGYYSFSKEGSNFRLVAHFHSLRERFMSSESKEIPVEVKESTALEDTQFSETGVVDKPELRSDELKTNMNRMSGLDQRKRIIVPVAADPVQQEALYVLKKLKIIENDVNADELCTRREYARWLAKANSMLERSPKHRIAPTILIADSMITAFDDVSVSDPDFWCIQALGESGITVSKLSNVNSSYIVENSDAQGRFDFLPESFISRFDLVNWKAMLEYPFTSEVKEKMLREKVGLFDLSTSHLDSSPHLLMDLMAGDRSITRRVFGNIRRLQPQKPVTKAQAAVALTSGRMVGAISAELARLEAENQSRLAEMEEIRFEIIQRGEIQKLWEEMLKIEREHRIEVERDFQIALLDLEEEREAQNESRDEYMKQKAALDYQQQLLHSLREEVDVMYLKLASERAHLLAEQPSLEKLLTEARAQQDAIVKAKSILEAEREALRMLRYQVEEEGRKAQARAKILEKAVLRWKWSS